MALAGVRMPLLDVQKGSGGLPVARGGSCPGEGKLWAERRLGELLAADGERRGGDRRSKLHDETLKPLPDDVSKIQSHRYQEAKELPVEDLKALIAAGRQGMPLGMRLNGPAMSTDAPRRAAGRLARLGPPQGFPQVAGECLRRRGAGRGDEPRVRPGPAAAARAREGPNRRFLLG